MEDERDIHDEMESLSPDFPKKPSISAPEGYFESFPDQILNQWREQKSKPVYKKLDWKVTISIAAAVLVLITGTWLIFSGTNTLDPLAEITSEEAYQYVYENIEEFESIMQYEVVLDADFDLDIPAEDIRRYLDEEIEDEEPDEIY